MPKLLAEAEYYRVITYKVDLGMTNVAIGDELGIRRQTVAKILKRNEESGSPLPNIKGRKKKTNIATTPQQDLQIEQLSRDHPFKTPRRLKAELNLNCSLATIKRRLRIVHLGGRIPAYKSFLTPEAKNKRLQFCKANVRKNWKNVMFSDEVLIQTSRHGMTVVRRPPGTRHDERYIREVNRNGRCKLMVWAAMTYNGLSQLVIIPGSLNQHNYISEILDPVVRPVIADHPGLIFMQDGAPAHKANTVKRFLQDNAIPLLDWPATSPDLNPIENLWQLLKEEVGDLNHIGPRENEQLINIVNTAWQRIQADRIPLVRRLYRSMKTRIKSCIALKGGVTKY